MPARHANVTITTGAAVAISDGSVTAARVSNVSGHEVWLQATSTSTPPASRNGGIVLRPYGTLAADLPLDDLFPGVGAGPYWLWGFSDAVAVVSVSHA
jgi:hypothetical protein